MKSISDSESEYQESESENELNIFQLDSNKPEDLLNVDQGNTIENPPKKRKKIDNLPKRIEEEEKSTSSPACKVRREFFFFFLVKNSFSKYFDFFKGGCRCFCFFFLQCARN